MSLTAMPPGEVAELLLGRSHLSHSSISCYQTCPLQFYFRYVERLPVKTVSANLVFGSAIHSCLQFYYEQLLVGNPPPDLDTLLGVYQEAWGDRETPVRFPAGQDLGSLQRLARRMLGVFTVSDLARPEGQIVGIEEELRGEISPDCPDLLARVDLLLAEDDALVVRDFKTARSRWSAGKVDCSADQLLIYHELAKPLAGGKPLRLEFAVLTKTQQPAVELYDIAPAPQRLDRMRRTVEQAIEAGHFYPAPSPFLCPGCAYRGSCRAWS